MQRIWIPTVAITLGLLGFTFGRTAEAQPDPDTMVERIFERLDQNKDDFIDRDEAKGSMIERRFDKVDRNEDGLIARDELRQALKERGSRRPPR